MGEDAVRLAGLLADADRLVVVAALALGRSADADLAAATGLDPRRLARALARLTAGGLVEPAPGGWRLVGERFAEAARSGSRPPAGEDEAGGADPAGRVLRAFVRDGRLVSIPASRSKRLVVLDWLAQRFEPGRRYTERETNDTLAAVHPDVAALRRYLVDEEFLARREGVYWRIGGTVQMG